MTTSTTTLHPLLSGRWSTRAFDGGHVLAEAEIGRLLEAARWAPSAGNSQPWRIGVARRGTPEHAALVDALAPGNAVWAGAASALVLVAVQDVDGEGGVRPWADYDAGQAAAHLSVQAEADGLAVHQMGGFDLDRAGAAFRLPEGTRPLVVIAIGRRDPNAVLPEPFASRETAPRTRLTLDEITLAPAVATLPLSA
ncbi:MAG: nitroreductase family protein [Frankiaceae bacterium]|nr:nitroreductase family protein [Frankiaceae bacterium]MBV9369843.1 nitroreductase family protein [Frankiales bacterium]